MKFIPILILLFLLQGCALFERKIEPPAIQPQVVNIDSAALEQCSLLREDIIISSFEDIISVYAEIATSYAICANRQATSVRLLKKFGNIK